MKHVVIGIEGFVGAGKTSICRELLNLVPNSVLLHGGNLYRAIIYALMKAKKEELNLENLKENLKNVDIKSMMEKLQIKIKIENRETVIYVGDQKIEEEEIQSQEASLAVSIAGKSADNVELYIFGKKFIEAYQKEFNVIVSGRDLMKIYPNLDYHFFITASLEERVRRKCIQYNSEEEKIKIKENIVLRDKIQEEAGYYQIYDNTIKIDVTDCKNARESADKLMEYIQLS